VDEIIHLGDYRNENAVRNSRKEIMGISHEIGLLFIRAYRFLKVLLVSLFVGKKGTESDGDDWPSLPSLTAVMGFRLRARPCSRQGLRMG
jgi:hypothetical protein